MVLRNMEHDGSRLEQDEIAFFMRWESARKDEALDAALLHFTERKKTDVVRLATSSSAQRTRMSRASPLRRSGEKALANWMDAIASAVAD